ncbi:MAG: uncharacterized protein PWP27_2373 [Clostridiales bacterium]|jgi:hypothetical protein|nr:uncharacterized protein [Clostridiales bacterium]MDK2934563.1 uncharacterized protein [Clostridiales bacterium]
MERLILTLLVAAAGGLAGHYLKIPAGAMIGAMASVAVYNIFTNQAYMPKNFALVLQILAGTLIGTRMTKETLLGLKDMWVPAIIIVFGVVIINFSIGFLMTKFSGLDLATSLFASAPGGITEMTLASTDLGADTAKVGILQFLRLISVITLLPVLLRFVLMHINTFK